MTVAKTREWLRGAVVAVPTPFHDDFSLDLDALRTNIEVMIERGVRTGDGVLLVAGAGGEFPTLTRDERIAVMRTSVEAAAGRVPTVTSIQHTDMREVLALAKAAEDVGHRRSPGRRPVLLPGVPGRPVPRRRVGRAPPRACR